MMYLSRVVILSMMLLCFASSWGQRRITPVETPATKTQNVNEFKGDTARLNAYRRANFAHYHDENGNIVYIDTITGEEWRDSTTMLAAAPKMIYPLLESMTFGVNLLDPFTRILGQKHGSLAEVWAMLSLHNRYMPVVELGFGQAKDTPEEGNFTYRSSVAPYIRLGADYNFLYNSTTDYQFHAGLRFGFTSFSYNIGSVNLNDPYWQEDPSFDIPKQTSTAFFWELVLGLRVKVWKNISAGWNIRYHRIAKESAAKYGRPWYIPGFGTRGGTLGLSFSVMYTIPIKNKKKAIGAQEEAPIPADQIPPNDSYSDDLPSETETLTEDQGLR